ncbi:TIGR02679 family protein [Kineococcus sp. NPDC059986]|uniref:TIGR02679 family protein n=1 Tax=Kineococcus sp. NPDC059986 TaxID=3155538 RepID=UPI00344E2A43
MNDARLRALLGGPDAAWLRRRVRDRIAAGKPVAGAVALRDASPAEREVVERLLGRPPRTSGSLSVRLEDVDAVLRRGAWPSGLVDAVVHLDGPVPVRADQAAAAQAAWVALLGPLDDLVLAHPWWADWWATARNSPAARRTVRSEELVADLCAVLAALPSSGEALGTLAQRTVRDPHALDGGALAGLVVSALAHVAGVPVPVNAAERRVVWASAGVALDDVSSTVLVAGFPGDESPTGRALESWRLAGLPTVLTLRHVVAGVPTSGLVGRVVHVCENPVVLRAALDEFGPATPPLVCLAGRPSAAGSVLLRSLADNGVRLRYHGDLDWGGLSIAGSVLALGAEAWRLSVADYRDAVRHSGRPLRGNPVPTPWDVELAVEVERVGMGVDEEAVLAELLADLSRFATG